MEARLNARNDDLKDELSRLREELSNVKDTVNDTCTYLPDHLISIRDHCPEKSHERYGGDTPKACCKDNIWYWPGIIEDAFFYQTVPNGKTIYQMCPEGETFRVFDFNSCACAPKILKDCIQAKSGPNEILTTPGKRIMANCDEEWLVIAHRYNGHEDFERRTWDEYKHGFGVTPEEYFIGFESLLTILNRGYYMLRIDYLGWERERGFAQYSSFRIGDVRSKYKLILAGYIRSVSTVRDRLLYVNGHPFSTKDVDNGGHRCMAKHTIGPWWYSNCGANANLFSTYDYNGPSCERGDCMYWHGFSHDLRIFTNRNSTIKEMKMKIKPFSAGFPL
ncbi:unnamed protein product [Owenia fusiformis]|uniref:Uncharacterized protein n=1 Tax=Owenia fusiformis TaxID=6347 RepID=A0A8J1YAF7_OWEFU|nr:unnamed protein product [Owenia fusiformis]